MIEYALKRLPTNVGETFTNYDAAVSHALLLNALYDPSGQNEPTYRIYSRSVTDWAPVHTTKEEA